MEFRYFTTRKGAAVSRFGTVSYIGCKRTTSGFVWNDGEVTRLPVAEIARNMKSYNRLIKCGDLVEVDEAAYDRWQKTQLAKSKKAAQPKESNGGADENSDDALDEGGGGGSENDPKPTARRGGKKTKTTRS